MIYSSKYSAVFSKTTEEFGQLSNMAAGFPIELNGICFLTSEALYQAMRFPDHPEIQNEIINQKSPMGAKIISRKYKKLTRNDWDNIKLEIMEWAINAKLFQNYPTFSNVLISTGEREIVEESYKDSYWGAKPDYDSNTLSGENHLGKILMKIRTKLPTIKDNDVLPPPAIDNFILLNQEIYNVKLNLKMKKKVNEEIVQLDLF